MALRENHILVDIMADADPLRDINREINGVTRNAQLMGSTINSQGDYVVRNYRRMSEATNWMMTSTRGMSQEALEMRREMQQAMYASKRAMYPFRDELIKAEYGMFKLTQSAKNYTGTNREFMREVQAAGAAHKKATDAMIAADEMQKMSMIRTVGTLMNRTTQAQRIVENYNRMGNPFYRVNNGLLGIADGMNKIAMRGQPAALALKMLGPTANMKKLRDMTMMIQQGLMRFTMVALIAAAGAAIFYKKLHDGAMEANKGYKRAFEGMQKSLAKAFEPLVQVFAMIMIPIFRFIKAMADMVVRFNEAHPTLSKLIAAFLVLIPILTLILSPLAIGIGLFGGLQAAMGALWVFIGPVVTGFAAMMGTVLLVSAAIVGLVWGIRHLWQTNDAFKNAIVTSWDAIKSKSIEVFGWLVNYMTPIVDQAIQKLTELASTAREQFLKGFGWLTTFLGPIFTQVLAQLTEFAAMFKDAIAKAFTGDFSGIFEMFKQLLPNIIGFLIGGIPGLIIAGARFIPAILEGIQSNANSLAFTIGGIVQDIAAFLTTKVPLFVNEGVKILTGLVQGVVTALPVFVEAIANIVLLLVNTISQVLPVILEAGIKILLALISGITTLLPLLLTTGINILMTLVNGILQMIPTLIPVAIRIITILINKIVELIPMLLQLGVQLIQGLLNGIAQALPMILNGALSIIMGLVNALVQNLPLILNAGIQILMALLNGIMQMLPLLLTTALDIIMQLVNTLTTLLPQILQVGIQILMKLIEGIIQMLPQLITMAVQLITSLANTLIENLPMIINAAVQIVVSLINGLIQMLPQLVAAALQLLLAIFNIIIENLPQMLSLGQQLIQALIDGIIQLVGAVGTAVWEIASTIIDTISEVDLFSIGSDIVQGLINGIGSMLGSLAETAGEIASTVMDKTMGLLGINSPSKVFYEYGGWTTEGYALGMQKELRMVDAMAREMAFTVSQPVAGITPDSSTTSTTNSSSESKTINFNPTINIQGGSGGDGGDVRQQVRDAMDEAFAHLLDLYDPEVSY